MRGRKPKPTALQIAEGDPRRRGVNKIAQQLASEPKATRGLPRCPSHLKGVARRLWKFWAEELEAMALDHRPDGPMLELACVAYQTYVECHEAIAKSALLVSRKKINPVSGQYEVVGVMPHPALSMRNAAMMQMRSFCSEFGLSPASRTRVAMGKSEDGGSDLMAILTAPREPKPATPLIQ